MDVYNSVYAQAEIDEENSPSLLIELAFPEILGCWFHRWSKVGEKNNPG